MKSKAVLTGLLLLLVFTSFSFKCGSSVPTDQFRGAAKAADDIAISLKTMTELKRKLGQDGSITKDQERALTDLLLKAVRADKLFVTAIKAAKNAPDASTKGNLCTLFANLKTALDDLNNTGLLPISNPGAKTQLSGIFTTIMGLVPTITSALTC